MSVFIPASDVIKPKASNTVGKLIKNKIKFLYLLNNNYSFFLFWISHIDKIPPLDIFTIF